MKPGKHQRSKQRCQDVGRFTTVYNLLFFSDSQCINYRQSKRSYWLVPQSEVNNCCVLCAVKAEKSGQKPTTKKFV